MGFTSVQAMLEAAKTLPLDEAIIASDAEESGLDRASGQAQMEHLWAVMVESSNGYRGTDRSNSGLTGGDGEKLEAALNQGILLGGDYLNQVTAEALKIAECNACMKRIVAAPTAGSCGVLPAVILPLYRAGKFSKEQICRALTVAAGFGQVIAHRATLSGAEGGCQAEVGSASAMAAAALVFLQGGTPEQCAHSASIALGNLLGLVCDPVAGLVEVPCVKRNVIGAVGAVAAANMALAGLTSVIPCDEVIDAMGAVGKQLHFSLRETGLGGLAGTPTGCAIKESVLK
jgi:L-serine dehydratase